MTLPSQTLTELNPGLAPSPSGAEPVLFIGPSSGGTANTIYSFSKSSDLRSALGYGPLVEYAALALTDGGPVLCMPSATSTAAANGTVTPTRVDSSIGTVTVSGDANDFYEVVIEITTTGDNGTGGFRYSLDNGRTYSPELTIPSGGTYSPPNTGLTLTFVEDGGVGTEFEDGDKHAFDATPAMLNATDVGNAMDALLASERAPEGIVICGRFADASSAAGAAATLQTKLSAVDAVFRYAYAVIDGGLDDTSTTITGWASFTDDRVCVAYGTVDLASATPYMGWGLPKRSVAAAAARRIKADLISTHTGRVASGSISGVAPYSEEYGSPVSHDEYRSPGMDAAGFLTVRTWPGRAGYYFTRGRIKAAPGSDFQRIELRRVMNTAKRTAQPALARYINSSVRVNPNGTIRESDAARIEANVNAALSAALLEPVNAEGTRGHCSTVTFSVDRTNNVQSSKTLQGEIAILSLGYLEQQVIVIGFVAATADATAA